MTVTDPWRCHVTYRTVDRPWGGANNFIRALKRHLVETGPYVFTDTLEEPCDLLFMNQLGCGPGADGRKLSLRQVRRAMARDGRKLAVRAVNLNRHAFRMGPRNLVRGTLEDWGTLKLLALADRAIFQSAYQRDVFRAAGYRGRSHTIIHNGADPAFWAETPPTPPGAGPLRLISATASPRRTKRHALIAAVSRLPGVEVLHCGAWPDGVETGAVKLQGSLDRFAMARLYREAHLFLHPAIKDPGPNAVFEAICAGLPVLYSAGPGASAEIVGANGLTLDDDDPAATVDAARRDWVDLAERVWAARGYYRIDRATAAYVQVFRALITGTQGDGGDG